MSNADDVEEMDVFLPPIKIRNALDASHSRLVCDGLVEGDPAYPFPREDFLEFVLIRLENAWEFHQDRVTWSVPDTSQPMTTTCKRCGATTEDINRHWDVECEESSVSGQSSLEAWS